MANKGVRFSDFYVAQGKSTVSRAALLSGCYPERIGLTGAINHTSTHRLNEKEEIIPELFKKVSYKTAIFGKWHLGYQSQFIPLKQGFDEFFGLPYSNDMWPLHELNISRNINFLSCH